MELVVGIIVFGAWAALVFIGYPVYFEMKARRPADANDEFIRRLPPPSQPLAVREAHLRLRVRQEAIQHVKVYAAFVGAVLILGLFFAASEQGPIRQRIAQGIAAAAILAGLGCVFYAFFAGFNLFSRYRSAKLRLHNDAQWHAGGDQPAAVPNSA
jgi:hypothetical protein